MTRPSLFTKDIRARLIANGKAGWQLDHVPVVKVIDPGSPAMWLFTELRPDDLDMLYGLIHDERNERSPTLGYASLGRLSSDYGRFREPLQCDPDFAPRYPLSVYATAARLIGRITCEPETLYLVATSLHIRPVVTAIPHPALKSRRTRKRPTKA
jgi:Protein of unknown function (DUF2958)